MKPLILLFKNSTKSSYYPGIWKRSNTILVHKKNNKRLVNNYQPISLLPIFGKIFEKIIFSRIYNFLLEENLLNPDQPGFRSSDACVNQLLAITHEFFKVRFGMKACFICSSLWASQENFTNFLKITYLEDSKWSF